MKKTNKKNSTARKLLPAFAMLTVSAISLSSATYAWFTMSRTVEITGIQMTATTPDTIQLSLGANMGGSGTLTPIGSSDGVGLVKAPANTNNSTEWSNAVVFSRYYQAAKLIPASSNTGATIYTTDDADGVGKTVNASGNSLAASAKSHSTTSSTTIDEKATLQLISSANTTALNSSTNDVYDGYYIDYPVWLRNSAASDANLTVKATVSDSNSGDLYKATRVSILTGATNATSQGVIIPYDGSSAQGISKYYTYTAASGENPASAKALSTTGTLGDRTGSPYDNVTSVVQTGETSPTTIVTVPGTSPTITSSTYNTGNCTDDSSLYGDAVCVIVRVWLEGEDTDCWNANAGQGFNLSLSFTKA